MADNGTVKVVMFMTDRGRSKDRNMNDYVGPFGTFSSRDEAEAALRKEGFVHYPSGWKKDVPGSDQELSIAFW